MRAFAPVFLLILSAAAQAEVRCEFNGRAIPVAESTVVFHYSASGTRGPSGKVSHFRLSTLDGSDGPTSSVELKAVDITTPGEYALTTESGWRSTLLVNGKKQKVLSGRFVFATFTAARAHGRAAGTVEFDTGATRGSCRFDVEFSPLETDGLKVG